MNMESVTLLLFVLCFTNISIQAKNVTVSVYYESLCPDSVRFLKNQFYPAYSTVLKDVITVDLVPFGKATAKNESGKWVFDCQHGERECYGNKVHGCAIDVAANNASTEFIVCAMKSGDASSNTNLQQCAADNNIPWSSIENCLNSGRGDEILASNGERTDAVKPKITFIPTIIFNGVYREQLQSLALKDFTSIAEYLLEDDCPKCSSSKTMFCVILLILPLLANMI